LFICDIDLVNTWCPAFVIFPQLEYFVVVMHVVLMDESHREVVDAPLLADALAQEVGVTVLLDPVIV
jgi:hypothetical protein